MKASFFTLNISIPVNSRYVTLCYFFRFASFWWIALYNKDKTLKQLQCVSSIGPAINRAMACHTGKGGALASENGKYTRQKEYNGSQRPQFPPDARSTAARNESRDVIDRRDHSIRHMPFPIYVGDP